MGEFSVGAARVVTEFIEKLRGGAQETKIKVVIKRLNGTVRKGLRARSIPTLPSSASSRPISLLFLVQTINDDLCLCLCLLISLGSESLTHCNYVRYEIS